MLWRSNLLAITWLMTMRGTMQLVAGEHVPVLLWESGSKTPLKNPPAFQKVSSEAFQDIVFGNADSKELIVVFAEENLSIEDFTWRNVAGLGSFSRLDNLTSEMAPKTQFLPAVEAPVHAMLERQEWQQLAVTADLANKLTAQKHKSYIFVQLNDAVDFEDRSHMLRRHDSIISDAIVAARNVYDNILVIYTGFHSSWFPGEERHTRKVRDVDAEEDEEDRVINASDMVLFYSSGDPVFNSSTFSVVLSNVTSATANDTGEYRGVDATIVYDVEGVDYTLILKFPETSAGYWSLTNITVKWGNEEVELNAEDITAKYGFSYHCSQNIIFKNEDGYNITFTEFQAEPRPKYTTQFSDTYDCVWFFTIPILSGLMVSIILAIILASGICMLSEIRTMDRFDDPKGKTITVTATE